RRVEQGGSWQVRVSLVQVAHWLASLGTVDAAQGAAELPEDALLPLLTESVGPLGRLRHLKPVIQLGSTPAYYARPAEPLGTSPAQWA
ncbi:MAG: CoA transferase, partial [Rhodospirillales bacterium]|nr:CoA transferase [Rhodospirillales bacterium]